MGEDYKWARTFIRTARFSKAVKDGENYRYWMKCALACINKIPNPEHRKKYVSMWFAAFNKTNNELRKSS